MSDKIPYKSASVRLCGGHFYYEPEKVPALVHAVSRRLGVGKLLNDSMRVQEDKTERLYFLEVTVKVVEA